MYTFVPHCSSQKEVEEKRIACVVVKQLDEDLGKQTKVAYSYKNSKV